MPTHRGTVIREARALGLALVVLLASTAARATVVPFCASASAVTRPGPISAGQAAIRLRPPSGGIEESQLRLVDVEGVEISLEVETLVDGSAFLRAEQDLDVGEYTLFFQPHCSAEGFELALSVVAAPVDVSSLGDLTVEYEAYCPGETIDTSVGPVARDYPPPIRASIAISDEAALYLPFVVLDFEDADDGSWHSGVLTGGALANPIVLSRGATCGGFNPSARPSRHTFTASSRIVNGPTLPTLTTEADVPCLDCPPVVIPLPTGEAGGSGETFGVVGFSGTERGGCGIASFAARRSVWWPELLTLVGLFWLKRRPRSSPRPRRE